MNLVQTGLPKRATIRLDQPPPLTHIFQRLSNMPKSLKTYLFLLLAALALAAGLIRLGVNVYDYWLDQWGSGRYYNCGAGNRFSYDLSSNRVTFQYQGSNYRGTMGEVSGRKRISWENASKDVLQKLPTSLSPTGTGGSSIVLHHVLAGSEIICDAEPKATRSH